MDAWILTHGDTDGLCSGALALAAHPEARVFFTNPYGLLEDLDVVEEASLVIICDIALSENHLPQVLEKFKAIEKKGELVYIDHHPLPEGISRELLPKKTLHETFCSTAELSYRFFQSKLDPKYSRVAIYGAIGDYLNHTHFIQKLLEKWDKRTLYFESGIIIQGIEGRKRDYTLKRGIISNLARNLPPSFDSKLIELAIEHSRREEAAVLELEDKVQMRGNLAYVLNYPFSLGKTALYIIRLTNALIGIAGEDWKGMVDMSLKTRNLKIDLNKLLRKICPMLGGSGGGHPSAAGARVPRHNFERFLDELNEKLALEFSE
ncbi:MAG: DHHA1 domain-containing protein [Methanocellales archaeon]